MEWFRFIRERIWRHTGFDSLRRIIPYIEDYEPWYEPLVIPRPDDLSQKVDSLDSGQAQTSPTNEGQDEEDDEEEKFPTPPLYYTIQDYRRAYLSGTLTPTDVVRSILGLIHPKDAPHSQAVTATLIPSALAAAEASTERYKQGRPLGPLDGVPTVVKDEYDVAGYQTTLGSRNIYASTEDGHPSTWCVQQLEQAGAIVIAKSAMTEFGLDATGNNPIYGTPRNPYNRRYYTGGSSSGTGYSVAVGLVPVGLGSDGGGSIRIPAGFCGVFGLKPTHGRVSFRPGQNHSITCACLGPMAADIESLATVFEVIAKPDPSSHFPELKSPLDLRMPPPSSDEEDPNRLLGIPIAWVSQASPAVQTLINSLIRKLTTTHGFRTVPISIPFLPEGQLAHAMTILTDAATLLPPPPATRNLTPANRLLLALGRTTPATDYLLAQKLRRLLMQHLAWLWEQHPGMLIITPTAGCAGLKIGRESDAIQGGFGVSDGDSTMECMRYAWLANFCGLPSLSVPVGFVQARGGDVPVGMMVTGEWCAEERLLRFGRVVERVLYEEGVQGRRRRPGCWVDVLERARERARERAAESGEERE